MRAVVVERYGPPSVARIAEVPAPSPGAGEVLVRVAAVAVTAGDARIRGGRFPEGFSLPARLALGIRRPRRAILGMAVSGTVEGLGDGVDSLSVGDEVAGMTGGRMGGHAELVVVEATRLVPKPSSVAHDDAAAALFGGSTAMHFLHEVARVRAGQTVLVIGAPGAVGSSAVQLARHAGAAVTGVTSARNAELVRGLGAEEVVDYATTRVEDLGARYDVVLDAVGTLSPATGRALLRPGGTLVLAVATLGQTITARGPVKAGPAKERPEHFARLLAMLEAGELDAVVQSMPMTDVARAHEIVDSGRKVGNLVIRP